MTLRRCHASDEKFGVFSLLYQRLRDTRKFTSKNLKNRYQINAHAGSAKYTLLI